MEKIRCFIAIELPPEIKEELKTLQQSLKAHRHSNVRWVAPDSIHLTLKFLGDVFLDTIPEVMEGMSTASQRATAFDLSLGQLGAFPNIQRPQVVWVGLTGDLEKLSGLQNSIESNMVPLGFAQETRRFSPHLTLGRVRQGASPQEKCDIGQQLSGINFASDVLFEVTELHLMESRLTPSGAIYSELGVVELGELNI